MYIRMCIYIYISRQDEIEQGKKAEEKAQVIFEARVRTYVYMCIYIYIYISYVCMYIYIYIYT